MCSHVDHLNTPRLVTNDQQQAVWRWDQQEPFGVSAPDENLSRLEMFDFPLRFPGQCADKETNLYYNYFRDYDASLGRYIESDPIGLRGGLNTYVYVVANPVKFVDPEGLTPICRAPTPVCDGKGGFEICLGPVKGKCDESCSRAHEEQHIQDLKRERPDLCRNKPRGTELIFDLRKPNDRQFLRRSECQAFLIGAKCRLGMLDRTCFGPDCERWIRNGMERDRRGIEANCD